MPAGPRTTCERCRAEIAASAQFCPMCGAARARRDSDPLLGEIIADRYLLRQRLGAGGSGTIYLGEHVTVHKRVAVKVLHHELSRDDLAVERFRREATTVAEIDNEHIVEVYDFGRIGDGRLFMAMELLDGETLAAALAREGPLPVARTIDILIQVGEALMEAHAMGYVHRDLRPGNVFLARKRGHSELVKLLDFGLAKLVEPPADGADNAALSLGMAFGDPRYMSPEQAHGDKVDRRGDIYSLGVMAYEMLTGKPPFSGKRVVDVLAQHIEALPPPPSSHSAEIGEWLDALVMRALAKHPEDRFVTVFRFIEALRDGVRSGRIMGRTTAQSMPSIDPPPPAPRPRDAEEDEAAEAVVAPPLGPSSAWFAEPIAGDSQTIDDTEKSASIEMSSVFTRERRRNQRALWLAAGLIALGVTAVGALAATRGGGSSAPDAGPVTLAPAPAPAPPAVAIPDAAVAVVAPPPDAAPRPRVIVATARGPQETRTHRVPLPQPQRDPRPPASDEGRGRPAPPVFDFRPHPDAAPEPPEPSAEPPPADPAPGGAATSDAAQAMFFVKLGNKALREGDLGLAASSFDKAREFDRGSAEAIAGIGEVAMRQGSYRDAVVHLRAAARLAPRSARIRTLLGQAYLGASQRPQAAAAFKAALALDPGDTEAARGLRAAAGR